MNLNNLKELIEDYINQNNTDYAILINGEWGSGKTFYLKNVIMNEIKNIPCYINNFEGKRSFKAVYVSLYGISDSAELRNNILLQLNPGLKKYITIGLGLAKKVVEKKLDIKIDSEIDNIINLYNIPKEWVLIFDDLERTEIKNLNEILGFINNYTEHENLKVLIIADEKQLIENFKTSKYDYEKIKEKLVRFTYTFDSDIEEVFSKLLISLVESRYRLFLSSKQGLICSIFTNRKYKNLRTLKFIIDTFSKAFNIIINIEELKKEYKDEILNRFFFSFCVYSIEYKKRTKY